MSSTDIIISENIADVNTNFKNSSKTTEISKDSSGKLAFYFKLILLYFLNISDWICTMALIGTGKFYEANPIMQPVLENFGLTVVIKGVLPLALTLICAVLFRTFNLGETTSMKVILYIGIIIYSLLNLWHIINFLLLFLTF